MIIIIQREKAFDKLIISKQKIVSLLSLQYLTNENFPLLLAHFFRYVCFSESFSAKKQDSHRPVFNFYTQFIHCCFQISFFAVLNLKEV